MSYSATLEAYREDGTLFHRAEYGPAKNFFSIIHDVGGDLAKLSRFGMVKKTVVTYGT